MGSAAQDRRHDRFDSPALTFARRIAQRGILRPVVHRVTRVTVLGTERLDRIDGPFIAVANHSSHLDAPLIMCTIPWQHGKRLAAGAAADYFFDVWWRRGLTALFFNAFPIRRHGGTGERFSLGALLDRGVPLLIFPEGTRSRDGSLGAFKSGAAAYATNHDAQVLPIALLGAYAAHPRGSSWPKRGRPPVAVVYGEPLRAEPGEHPRAFTERIHASIASMLDEHASLVAQRGDGPAERGSDA